MAGVAGKKQDLKLTDEDYGNNFVTGEYVRGASFLALGQCIDIDQ
jgi:hypothetical protein